MYSGAHLERKKMLNFFKKKEPANEPFHVEINTGAAGEHKINKSSPTWLAVDKWISVELERLRRLNDSRKLTETHTQFLRGRIHALKGLKALPDKEKGILNK